MGREKLKRQWRGHVNFHHWFMLETREYPLPIPRVFGGRCVFLGLQVHYCPCPLSIAIMPKFIIVFGEGRNEFQNFGITKFGIWEVFSLVEANFLKLYIITIYWQILLTNYLGMFVMTQFNKHVHVNEACACLSSGRYKCIWKEN